MLKVSVAEMANEIEMRNSLTVMIVVVPDSPVSSVLNAVVR